MDIYQEPREFINKVLSIIEYQDNKEEFVEEFLNGVFHRAIVYMAKSLPLEDQKDFTKRLNKEKDEEKLKLIIEPYVNSEEYIKYVGLSTQEIFQDFLKEIIPYLNGEKKDKLAILIIEFSKTYS